MNEKKVKELISSLIPQKRYKRKQRVMVFSAPHTSAKIGYKMGELCEVIQVDGGSSEIEVRPLSDGDSKRQSWVYAHTCLPEGMYKGLLEAFSTSLLREDLPPFAKRGAQVKVNSDNFININNELFLEADEFEHLI